MELLDVNRSVMLVIDLQGKLMDMIVRPRLVIDSSLRLLQLAGLFQVPVVLTEQYPKGIGPTHPEVKAAYDALTTPKRYLDKTSFGCCGDPSFEPVLREMRPGVPPEKMQVVVAGIEAHICVMATVIELRRMGYQVHLCWEAISGRGEEYRKHAFDRMMQAGAVVTNHESVAFEWARDKNHACFKDMNQLFKGGQLT